MKKIAAWILLIALLLCACGPAANDAPTGESPSAPSSAPPTSSAPAPPEDPVTAPPSSETPPEPSLEPVPSAEPSPEPAPDAGGHTIRIEDAVLDKELDGVSLDLHYPVIVCDGGGVSGDLRDVAEAFYRYLDGLASEYPNAAEEGWFSELTYDITFHTDDVASIVFHFTEYTGGVHPSHSVTCRTWAWSAGAVYVQDLFDPYSPAQDKTAFWDSIMAEIQRQIRTDYADALYPNAADSVWDGFDLDMLSLAEGGVTAHYDEYVLGFYADGQPEFFIPLGKIDAQPIEWIAPGTGDPVPDPDASYFELWNGTVVGYFGPSGEVILPDGVTGIGSSAFYGVAGLTSVIVPDGVTYIGLDAFSGCSELRSIALPATLTDIEMGAFDGAWGLTDVYYAGTQDQWNRIAVGMDNDPLLSASIHFAG